MGGNCRKERACSRDKVIHPTFPRTALHYKDGKIVDEWQVSDEVSMLMQVKLAQGRIIGLVVAYPEN